MKTKLWHLGIASAIMATMGVAQAQYSPGTVTPNSAPAASDGVTGVPPASSGSADSASPALSNSSTLNSSPNWDSSRSADPNWSANQASPADTSNSDASTTSGPLLGVGERGNQSSNNNDGLNVPPAYGAADMLSDSPRSGSR